MRKFWIAAAIVAAAAAGLLAGSRFSGHNETAEASAEAGSEGSVAHVTTVTIAREKIEETLLVYGEVVPAPGEERTVSVPFESRVAKVMVAAGQVIESGDPLVEIEPSPDAALDLVQARSEADAARRELDQVKERLSIKLATVEEAAQAESHLSQAQARYSSLKKRDMGKRMLRADTAGLVTRVNVQPGDIVPAGDVLVATVGSGGLAVRLGVESEDLPGLHEGQTVGLQPVLGRNSEEMAGRITVLGNQVNPETRMVDVFATPAEEHKLLLNQYVRGRILSAATEALVAPRKAVLPEDGGHIVYVVEDGHARRLPARLGIGNDDKVQLLGDGFKEGQRLMVVGNGQVSDGMTVAEEPAR